MVTVDEYMTWDGVEIAGLIRAGEVTAAEIDAVCRSRIEQVNPVLNAVAELRPLGLVPAEEGSGGELRGVPTVVKELLAFPGMAWTMGSRLLAHNEPGPPSPYVERLLGAGLNVVGSTTSAEFGLLGSTESMLRGVTGNPWGAGLSAGGSSGGSAAAVAAGIVPIAHANDAGGSIRGPAALTGLFGFMPSARRCEPTGPEAGGLAALVVDHCITRSVRDSASFLAATERLGAKAVHEPLGFVREGGGLRLRIGILRPTLAGSRPDPDLRAALDRTAALCEDLGHQVADCSPLAIDAAAVSHAFFASAGMTLLGMSQAVTPMLGRAPGPEELEPFTLELIDWASGLGPDTSSTVAATFAEAATAYLSVFAEFDVVLSPTLSRQPWPLGTLHPSLGRDVLVRRTEDLVGYTPIHNISGCPAMSVPLETIDDLPVGMQFAAAPGNDATLLRLAYQLEAARPWHQRRPNLEPDGTPPPWPRP